MSKNIAIAYQMKKKSKGGPVDSGSPTENAAAKGDCPACGYSEGGVVADALPNEFDAVELSEEGKANDVVSRAMKKRFGKE